ncbi:hypothetical protein [Microbulbifer sp. ALW1]|uniref:hypothetical protein n=1 Tax=Microbulbifer sp. (strain ALW1) TaxID=1516059 RepID=UPI00135928E4|nr:hypothetical protein [Microbulbifer sp. ALW1]
MQEAAEIEIGPRARSGTEATPPDSNPAYSRRRPADAMADSSTAPDSPTQSPPSRARAVPAPNLLERLSPGPQDLKQLTCGCHNHRQLKRWIRSYLQQNPIDHKTQRNAGTLRSLLAEITRWTAPASLRLASLEILRPIILAHCDLLALSQLQGKDTASQGHGQTQEQRRDLLTAAILYQHQALAYTSACVQLVREPHTLLYRRRLARALHRGIDSYRQLIQVSSHFYLATPKNCWGRMQRLLQLAREQHLAQRRVLDPLAKGLSAANPLRLFSRWETPAHPYLQVALFASANPLQLGVNEQQQLWQCCDRWARQSNLLDNPQPGAKGLVASLKLDQPPIPAVRLRHSRVDMKHFSAPLGWSIDLRGPLQQLQRCLRRPGKLSPDMLLQVQALWDGEKGRDGQRTPVDIRCEVVLGISAICHHLKQGDEPAPELTMTFAPGGSGQPEQRLVMEVDSIDYLTGRALKDYEVSMPGNCPDNHADNHADDYSCALPSAPSVGRRNKDTANTQKRYQPIAATLLNTSNSGAGLRLPPDTQGRLHSGDLIALRVNSRWEIAMVRWQYALPEQCRAGVEMLGGHTSAVRAHRHIKGGRRSDPIAGLLTGDAGHPPELLLPTPLFQQGDRVDIVAAGQTRTVTLHQQTLATGSFAIFEFS